MHLKVYHETRYVYDKAPSYLVQRLHLVPAEFATQKVLSWTVTAPGFEHGLRYVDAMGNIIHLVTATDVGEAASIIAAGEVETTDASGVVRGLKAQVPETVFLRQSKVARVEHALSGFAGKFSGSAPVLERCHDLMAAVHEAVAYDTDVTHADTTADEAFAAGRGVCQDHAHIMIAVARHNAIPARYVTGYLVTGKGASSVAAHAWAELFVADLGWVGFDAANGQCPNEYYVRIAAGLDAAEVTPVNGSRRGGSGAERLSVEVRVEIAQQ